MMSRVIIHDSKFIEFKESLSRFVSRNKIRLKKFNSDLMAAGVEFHQKHKIYADKKKGTWEKKLLKERRINIRALNQVLRVQAGAGC